MADIFEKPDEELVEDVVGLFDQAVVDNQVIARAAGMVANAWPWSRDLVDSPQPEQVIDHGWDWSPDLLGGNEWRRPTEIEIAIHMMRMLESLRLSEVGLREIRSAHIRMWLDEEDALHIALDIA